MGWTLKRQRPSFVLCLAIGLIGLAIFSVTLHPLPSPSQDGATPGFLPSLPKPRAINDATNATPPSMGWNSWNAFACGGLDESLVRQTADAMDTNGLLAPGYTPLPLNDGWPAVSRASQAIPTPDSPKF